MKITKSQLKRIIKEELREAKFGYSSPGHKKWKQGEQNTGLNPDLERQIPNVPPEDLMKNYENGLSRWITQQIINKKIGTKEEAYSRKEEWIKDSAYTFKQLADETVERIISKGIEDAFKDASRHDSEVP